VLLACDWRVVVHVGAPESLCTQLKLVGSEFSYLAQNEDLQKTDKKAGLYALAPHAARGLYPPAASSWHSERPASSVPCVGAHGCSPIVIWGVDAVKKSRTQCHPLASTRRRRAQPAAAARATLAHANRHLAGSENDIIVPHPRTAYFQPRNAGGPNVRFAWVLCSSCGCGLFAPPS
jgi:hypothetical protein